MIANPSNLLAHHADRRPDSLALEFEGRCLTWDELHRRVSVSAAALGQAGVHEGDVVGVLLHNSLWPIEIMFAVAHLGAVYMPLNWRLAGPELRYILDHSEAKLLVTESEFQEISELGGEEKPRVVSVDPSSRWQEFEELRSAGGAVPDPAEVAQDQLARLMYTSGTTARPKGVMVTFGNIAAKNLAHIVEFGIGRYHRNLVSGPLYHTAALDGTTTTFLEVGAPTFILRRFDVEATLAAIERHRITHVWLAPVMINAILRDPRLTEFDLSSLELLMNGGEKLPLHLIERCLSAFENAWLADGYGMTETVSGDAYLDAHHTIEKRGSVGKPVYNAEIRIVDPFDRPVEPGVAGEIVMRGPKVCRGYFKDAEATANAMRGGWLHTGDVGLVDEDGFLFIVDRLKDMIKTGGENVASLEIERVVYEHPSVSDVAVVGKDDPEWLEVPVAFVVRRDETLDQADLLEFCRARLASFKVPKEVHFVAELPRNPSGKILKRELRDRVRGEVTSP